MENVVKLRGRRNVTQEDIYDLLLGMSNGQGKFQESVLQSIQHASKVSVKKQFIDSKLEQYLNQIDYTYKNIVDNFDELDIRLKYFVNLKGILKDLIDAIKYDELNTGVIKVCLILYDGIRKHKAEDLTHLQLKSIGKVIGLLVENNIKDEDYVKVDQILLNAGLCWIMGDE